MDDTFDDDDLTELAHGTALEAHLLHGLLQSEGITSFVVDDQMGQALWCVVMGSGGVRVMVPIKQLSAAQQVLNALQEGRYTLDENFDDYTKNR